MIVVDRAIEARRRSGRPVVVGLYGSGFMGRGMLINVERHMPVVHVAAICNRTVERAVGALLDADVGRADVQGVSHAAALDRARDRGQRALTGDPALNPRSAAILVFFEATADVTYAATVTPDASGRA